MSGHHSRQAISPSAIAGVRARTQDAHAAVDAAFGGYRLDDEHSYVRFLQAHARALPAAERALAGEPGLPAWRPRTALLIADLAAMGGTAPQPLSMPLPKDVHPGAAYAWGLLYVLEGSRLGGKLLAGRVPDRWPATYLRAIHMSGEWRATRIAIEDQAATHDPEWLDRAIVGAKACFDLYLRAAASPA